VKRAVEADACMIMPHIPLICSLFYWTDGKSERNAIEIHFSKEVEDAVYSNLTLHNGLSGRLGVNWSDETYCEMATQITIFGKEVRPLPTLWD